MFSFIPRFSEILISDIINNMALYNSVLFSIKCVTIFHLDLSTIVILCDIVLYEYLPLPDGFIIVFI